MEKFTKVKNIGKGNMGACALARNNEDGRYYVIKQVDLAKLNKKERQQSLNEAKVLSSLRHPNVINYVDSFLARKSDHLCIVMEFADGGDLSGKIKHSHGANFPQEQVLDWFIQVALALHYIHGKKILHRDVKTQNIFLTQEGVCKLGDFGIARTLNSTFDQANTFVGTPYYLSPELILERPYDAQSDVWALGVVLYELLALRHPFNANDMKGLMHRILKVQYDAPPHIYSNELRSIVARMLVKDPGQRVRLAELLQMPIVIQRMQQWLQGGVVPSRYVASLIRHKLFPAAVNVAAYLPEGQLPVIPAAQQRRQQDEERRPLLNDSSPIPGRAADAEYSEKQLRREEIRNDFSDVKLKPKPAAAPDPSKGHRVEPSLMPMRDPQLLGAEPVLMRAAAAPAPPMAQPRVPLPAIPRESGRSGIVAALSDDVPIRAPQRPQVDIRSGYPINNDAIHMRPQPSLRPVNGINAPVPGVPRNPNLMVPPPLAAGPNANIHQLLEKAAQQRMLGRQPRKY